ncbi:MAG: hypothetical protein COB34_01165 [Methylophilaceae bacterium]|nr:MAG: hypothetical protein COB34_01165 [Methylophilaceae bacterium]
MNYITSCPKCDTHFVLNDALIKAHRGKVQCGSCEHVFNAKNRLTEVADDITSADDYQASLSDEEAALDEPTNADTDTSDSANEETTSTADIDIGAISPSTVAPTEPEYTIDLDDPATLDDFTKSLEPPKKTSKHPILLSLFGLLLVLTAVAQTVYTVRTQIAAEYPQFKPLLVKACAQLHCTINLPKNLDLITIGDSDMQEDDNYQSVINFSSSLTNKANYPQAYPNIELTLTDADDKIVIRKLITPKDYLTADKKIQDGLAAHEVSPVKLAFYVNETSVAGYRIFLVY